MEIFAVVKVRVNFNEVCIFGNSPSSVWPLWIFLSRQCPKEELWRYEWLSKHLASICFRCLWTVWSQSLKSWRAPRAEKDPEFLTGFFNDYLYIYPYFDYTAAIAHFEADLRESEESESREVASLLWRQIRKCTHRKRERILIKALKKLKWKNQTECTTFKN